MASKRVAAAAATGVPRDALVALNATLDEAMREAPDSDLAGLAGRKLEVLLAVDADEAEFESLRDLLATAVDVAAAKVGDRDDQGRPLGRELAPLTRQLNAVLREMRRFAKPKGQTKLDELAARRAARISGADGAGATGTDGKRRR